ncbi:hypothetical protein ACWGII_29775 [Streptomyces sp. NPDC054855]
MITQEQCHDEAWVDAHTRWIIASVERIATRNHPLTDEELNGLLADEERVFPGKKVFGSMR